MTTTETIDTGVDGVSAAHLTLTAQATHRQADLTLVWSTRTVRCCGTQPAVVMDGPPRVWDRSGCGDWTIPQVGQCGGCGQLMLPIARLRDGHLHGAALAAVARSVRAEQDDELEQERAKLRAALNRQVRWVAEYEDIDDIPVLDEMDEPGVGRTTDDDGRTVLVAWDYDPADDDGTKFLESEYVVVGDEG